MDNEYVIPLDLRTEEFQKALPFYLTLHLPAQVLTWHAQMPCPAGFLSIRSAAPRSVQMVTLFEAYDIPIKVVLLTGSMTAKEKRRAYDRIECGLAKIIVGTHALIQDAVYYDNLALVVTDEQHRFGVKQRESFEKKAVFRMFLL